MGGRLPWWMRFAFDHSLGDVFGVSLVVSKIPLPGSGLAWFLALLNIYIYIYISLPRIWGSAGFDSFCKMWRADVRGYRRLSVWALAILGDSLQMFDSFVCRFFDCVALLVPEMNARSGAKRGPWEHSVS